MLYQQGDVLIETAEIPKSAKKVQPKNGKLILAEGEATGHTHAIANTEKAELFEQDGRLWLGVKKSVEVKHEEHHSITLPPGDFEVRKVQEYDHFFEESKDVVD